MDAATARRMFGTWIRGPRLWLAVAASVVLLAAALALAGRFGPWADSGFVEYRMPIATDIPVSIAVTRDGTV